MIAPRLHPAAWALALFAAAALAEPPDAAGAAGALGLTIVFTGDVSGYLEPCG
jgi:hypothetical protein